MRPDPPDLRDRLYHAALSETGVVYVTAQIHEGWESPQPDGRILNHREAKLGGHAFLLVGYDTGGFWIQNSWGREWGRNGFARMAYADWLENGMDAWIGQWGVYVTSHMDSLGQGLKIERAVEVRRATKQGEGLGLHHRADRARRRVDHALSRHIARRV
jgi:hypothetical protein